MLYFKEDIAETVCRHCNAPRFKPKSRNRRKQKDVPVSRMFYFPIIPRLQRLYASMRSAAHMRWHNDHIPQEGVITHPSEAEAWKHFDRTHPTFAAELRNVRLGLCADGFTPFSQSATPYSCWPVILTPYNLPPELCMTTPYMFLSLIIPGPHNPKLKIDVFLQPLIDDLSLLWEEGVSTYDISTKQNFTLRAALLWTIGDFPAYGMLSGWNTSGKLACPYCLENTKSFTLKYGRKNSWFDCHRMFLPQSHPFRRNKEAFTKNKMVMIPPPPRFSSEEIYGVYHNWTKKSIFWSLPYWRTNLIRHNLDVMHIEKNVFDNIFYTVMDIKEKSKDNIKARMDLKEICRRKALELKDGSSKLNVENLIHMEQQIPFILCQLEKIFPPGFFDSMEHLPIHLPYEAMVGGPVQYRWMYPFERYLNKLKKTAKNKARPEGSICEAYLTYETTQFCSYYFETISQSGESSTSQNVGKSSNISVFSGIGEPLGASTVRYLTDKEMTVITLYILLNCDEVEPYLEKVHAEDSSQFSRLSELAWGPNRLVKCYQIFEVNGYKFQTKNLCEGRKTENSGVCVRGNTHTGDDSEYYGVLQEILEVEYPGMRNIVYLFNCEWFDPVPNRGTKVHPIYGITEVKRARRYAKFDPFIIASQATQVYYANYPSGIRGKQDWLVVMKTKPRGVIEKTSTIPTAHQEEFMSNLKDLPINVDDQIRFNESELQLEEVDLNIEESDDESDCARSVSSDESESTNDELTT
ncbi:hypothetical protein MA16_Dca001225 [Dendrobium catenatum]|uniref:DUF4218 domain-containing protein n=1 Tax=Dendrobium catenatum TaxID=906689 RepID=A0A2I0VPK1_9ASPA|nr:hypothetical protein MA16_Dca026737 [Dendrobium catenatum]PKU76620.1 hypothetical protein MA16_Dca001225 [Dendrobium catenatum]